MSPGVSPAWSDLGGAHSRQSLEQGRPENAVNCLAPCVALKSEFHLCEGLGLTL